MSDAMDPIDPAGPADPEVDETEREELLDRFRGSGEGTEDPNIVGDAGALDVAPGSDGPAAEFLPAEGVDHVET